MSNVRVRFAPSPTGMLHIGGARTALFNWLFARSQKGTFVLRIEDTDEERQEEEFFDAIFDGMRWLGLDWDEGLNVVGKQTRGKCGPYRQSQRTKIYDKYFNKLKRAKLVYQEEDGCWRFKCPQTDRTVNDMICGETVFKERDESDMTIKREDGSYIFHFVSVVDDIEMKITHVIRGEDHLSNTPRHLDLYEAFEVEPPTFAHIPLILNADGSKMSKRDRGAAIHEYKNMGFHRDSLINYMSMLGWSPKNDEEIFSYAQLKKQFKIANVNRSNGRFDYDKVEWFSQQYIHAMGPKTLREALVPFLEEEGIPHDKTSLPDALLKEVQEKIKKYSDAAKWLQPIYRDDFARDGEALEKLRTRDGIKDILKALRQHLEGVKKWTQKAVERAIETAADELELRKGALMFPCRVAVSGQTGGLGLLTVLDRVGQKRSVARIDETLEKLA